jgi:hypothetical protein
LAAVTAALRRVIEDDKYPRCRRGWIRCGRRWRSFEAAPEPAAIEKPVSGLKPVSFATAKGDKRPRR